MQTITTRTPTTTLYGVYEANAYLECVALVYTGVNKDIANAVAFETFQSYNHSVNVVVLDRNTKEMLSCYISNGFQS